MLYRFYNDYIFIRPIFNFNHLKKMTGDWLNLYAPKNSSELVINKSKLRDINAWISKVVQQIESTSLLVISGPPGVGKYTTLKILVSNMQIQIQEWTTPIDISFENVNYGQIQSQASKFEEFLFNCGRYGAVFRSEQNKLKLIIIREYPNVFFLKPNLFHDIVKNYCTFGRVPIVFLCTEQTGAGVNESSLLFPQLFLKELKIQHISFKQLSVNAILKALHRISTLNGSHFPPGDLQQIAKIANGDIKNAVLLMEYASISLINYSIQMEMMVMSKHCSLKEASKIKEQRNTINLNVNKASQRDKINLAENFRIEHENLRSKKTECKISKKLNKKPIQSKTATSKFSHVESKSEKQGAHTRRRGLEILKKKSSKRRKHSLMLPNDDTDSIKHYKQTKMFSSDTLGNDKHVSIFQRVGRILYPKTQSEESIKNKNFESNMTSGGLFHDPEEIVNETVHEMNLFIQLTYENYLKTFRDIHDVKKVTSYLSTCDTFMNQYYDVDFSRKIVLSTIIRSFMICNQDVIRKWNPLTIQEFQARRRKSQEIAEKMKSVNPQYSLLQKEMVVDFLFMPNSLNLVKMDNNIAKSSENIDDFTLPENEDFCYC